MKVKSIAEYAILLTCIKRLLVLKTNFLSFLEWPFYTGFAVSTFQLSQKLIRLVKQLTEAKSEGTFSRDKAHIVLISNKENVDNEVRLHFNSLQAV